MSCLICQSVSQRLTCRPNMMQVLKCEFECMVNISVPKKNVLTGPFCKNDEDLRDYI